MPDDRRPPLRKRLRYRWDSFGDPDTGVQGWLNRRSNRVQILVILAVLVVFLTAMEVFSQDVLGLDPWPSSDRNEPSLEQIENNLPVVDLRTSWITSGQLKRLHPGMTVDEVTTILGSEGSVVTRDGAGSETRRWLGLGISDPELVFQAGVLVSITPIDVPAVTTRER